METVSNGFSSCLIICLQRTEVDRTIEVLEGFAQFLRITGNRFPPPIKPCSTVIEHIFHSEIKGLACLIFSADRNLPGLICQEFVKKFMERRVCIVCVYGEGNCHIFRGESVE